MSVSWQPFILLILLRHAITYHAVMFRASFQYHHSIASTPIPVTRPAYLDPPPLCPDVSQDLENVSWLESASPDRSIPFVTRAPGSVGGAAADLSTQGSEPLPEESVFDDLPVFADERSKVRSHSSAKGPSDL